MAVPIIVLFAKEIYFEREFKSRVLKSLLPYLS